MVRDLNRPSWSIRCVSSVQGIAAVEEGGVKEVADSDADCLASTRSGHQSHPQAAREVDKD